jgi:uncharacterized membrane protein SpoIIM required for sporulation
VAVKIVSIVTEAAFVSRRQTEWDELDALTRQAVSRGVKRLVPANVTRLPALYRDACADLARARAARYSAPLVDYLQGLTAAAHAVVYGTHAKARLFGGSGRSLVRAAFEAFPRAVRRHKAAVCIAALLFFVPFVLGYLAAASDPNYAFQIVPESTLRPLTEAYAKGFGEGRATGQDAAMAGFYVNNNVGIALRCFALGIFFGIGSAFALVFNGLFTGAVLGYVTSQGAGENILTFMVGHGSLELGAIVLAGGAGLAVGWSIVAPGDKTRIAALQSVGRDVVSIVFGAAVMLFMAASIEGFWSASSAPALVKRSVGGVLLALVLAYLVFVGRRSDEKEA